MGEIGKLTAMVSFGGPDGLFGGAAPRVVPGWQDQAMTGSHRHTRSHPPGLQVALLSALLYYRGREITGHAAADRAGPLPPGGVPGESG